METGRGGGRESGQRSGPEAETASLVLSPGPDHSQGRSEPWVGLCHSPSWTGQVLGTQQGLTGRCWVLGERVWPGLLRESHSHSGFRVLLCRVRTGSMRTRGHPTLGGSQ